MKVGSPTHLLNLGRNLLQLSRMYSTAQFKLDRTCVQQGHNMFFISHVCKPLCASKVDHVKPTVQSSRVRTRRVHDAHVHVRNAHAKFGLHVQANCKLRTAE